MGLGLGIKMHRSAFADVVVSNATIVFVRLGFVRARLALLGSMPA